MPLSPEITLLIVGAGFLVLLLALLVLTLRVTAFLRSTQKDLEEVKERIVALEGSITRRLEALDPIIENTENITRDIGAMTADMRKKLEQTSDFFVAAEEAAHTVRSVTGVLRSGLLGVAVEIAGIATGAKATCQYLTKKLLKPEKTTKERR